MKSSFITQVFFFILAGLLVWFAVFQHEKKNKKKQEDKTHSLIFKDEVNKDSIASLMVKRQDGHSFVLEKNKNKWNLIDPIQDKADSNKINALINDLLNQEVTEIASENVDWSEYGLNPPFSTIAIKTAEKTWEVGINQTPNFEDRYFIKKGSDLLLGSSRWSELSRLWPDTYRSKKLYHFNDRPIKLYFKTKNKDYKFNYQDYSWKWEGRDLFPLSHSAFENFWTSLREEWIDNFTEETKSSALKKSIWRKPDMKLQLTVLNEDSNESKDKSTEWTLLLKRISDDKIHIIISDRDFVYAINDVSEKKFLSVDFRDHKFPFQLNLKKMSVVEVKILDLDFSMEKKNQENAESSGSEELSKWKIVQPEGHQLDDKNFGYFMNWLENLEARDYYSKSIEKANGTLVIKDDKENTLLQMIFGSVFKNKEEKEWIYVQTSNTKETLAIDYEGFKQALSSSLIKKVKDTKSE